MVDVSTHFETGTGVARDVTTNNGTSNYDADIVIWKRYGFLSGGGGLLKTDTMNAADTCFTNAIAVDTSTLLELKTGAIGLSADNLVNQSANDYIGLAMSKEAAKIVTFTYTGDGSDPQTLSSILSSRAWTWIVSESATDGYFYTQYQEDNSYDAKALSASGTAGVISWNGASGIDVSGVLNTNTEVYHGVAGLEITDLIDFLGYAGDGVDDRDLSIGLSGAPEVALGGVVLDGFTGRQSRIWHTTGGDDSATFNGTGSASNRYQSSSAGILQIGNDGEINRISTARYVVFTFDTGTDAGAPTGGLFSPLAAAGGLAGQGGVAGRRGLAG